MANVTDCGFYIAHNPIFDHYDQKHVFKIGYSASISSRLTDGCYTTCFLEPFTYKKVFYTLRYTDARKLESGVKLWIKQYRQSELCCNIPLPQLIKIARSCADNLNIEINETDADLDLDDAQEEIISTSRKQQRGKPRPIKSKNALLNYEEKKLIMNQTNDLLANGVVPVFPQRFRVSSRNHNENEDHENENEDHENENEDNENDVDVDETEENDAQVEGKENNNNDDPYIHRYILLTDQSTYHKVQFEQKTNQ